MKKRSIITITAALLLLGMLRGCAKTPPAYDPSMAALLFGGTFGAELVVIHRRRVKQR